MAAAVSDPAAAYLRAHAPASSDDYRAKWRLIIKHLPPVQRLGWLSGAEGIAALGAKQCQLLRKEIERRHEAVRANVCGDAWLEAWDFGGQPLPGFRVDLHRSGAVMRASADGRRFSVRLVLSGQGTASGLDVPGDAAVRASTAKTRRLTPPQVVESEDALDAMTPREAQYYSHPVSPSAQAIFLHVVYTKRSIERLKNAGGRVGRLKAAAAGKRKAEQRAGLEEPTGVRKPGPTVTG